MFTPHVRVARAASVCNEKACWFSGCSKDRASGAELSTVKRIELKVIASSVGVGHKDASHKETTNTQMAAECASCSGSAVAVADLSTPKRKKMREKKTENQLEEDCRAARGQAASG